MVKAVRERFHHILDECPVVSNQTLVDQVQSLMGTIASLDTIFGYRYEIKSAGRNKDSSVENVVEIKDESEEDIVRPTSDRWYSTISMH